MKTVLLLGELGKKFGRKFSLDVKTPAEAVRALCANFPELEKFLAVSHERNVGYKVFVGKENIAEDQLTDPVGQQEIKIVPVIMGAGAVGRIILGAVLIVAGIVVTGLSYGWAAPVGNAMIAGGVGLIIGGVVELLSPMPKAGQPDERPENQPSYTFSGAVNTTAQGHPVPIGYGRMIVGSAVISAGITTEEIIIPGQTAPVTESAGVVAMVGGDSGGGGK